jgi:hypothetical protein
MPPLALQNYSCDRTGGHGLHAAGRHAGRPSELDARVGAVVRLGQEVRGGNSTACLSLWEPVTSGTACARSVAVPRMTHSLVRKGGRGTWPARRGRAPAPHQALPPPASSAPCLQRPLRSSGPLAPEAHDASAFHACLRRGWPRHAVRSAASGATAVAAGAGG